MTWDVCRVCLAGNIKMHSISNTPLQDIYEKLTGNQWIKDRRPAVICYVCHSQLNNSQKFKEMCKLSEEVFSQLYAGGFELTEETVLILNKRKLQKMLVTPIETMALDTFMENGMKEKDGITKKIADNREKKLQKLLVTPIKTATFSLDADEIQPLNNLKNQNLQKILVTPIETAFSSQNADEIQLINNLRNQKLQKLLVTPIKTASIGTDAEDEEEIPSINNLKEHKLGKLLVTPVVPATVETFYQDTVVKEEILSPKEERPRMIKLEAPSLVQMDTNKNSPQETDNIENNPISDDIILYIPSQETLDISSSNEDKKVICKVKSEVTEPPVTYEADIISHTQPITDQSSQNNHVNKKVSCITLRFKINGITNRNTQSVAKQEIRIRKREYPFKNVNANDVSRYVCKYCDKTFLVKYKLDKHMIRHADAKPFACDACDRTFYVKQYLKLHQRIHTGDKPFPCSKCHKVFHRLSYLNKHLKRHDKEKLFECGLCQRSFKELVTLKQHERTHTGEKPYACDECFKRFNQLSNLIQHKRLHSGEKPYRCSFCLKAFHQKSNLQQHVNRYHDKKK